MNILYHDKYIIVCIKPPNVLSQWDSNKENMISILSELTGDKIFPVHRLDKEVSGVMVFAKTAPAAANLSSQITDRSFQKEYLAAVHNAPVEKSGEMVDFLFKDRNKNKSFVVKRERRGVKKAKLEYTVIKIEEVYFGTVTLVQINLYTGRTHQIRVQFSSRKMPVVGDKKYGSPVNILPFRLMSYKIGFSHPKSGEQLDFCYDKALDEIFNFD